MKSYATMYLTWGRHPFNRILAETILTVAGKILVLAAQFLGIKALTTLMTMENYGHLSLILSASMVANVLFYGPFGQGAARFLTVAIEQHSFIDYERAIRKLACWGTGVILIIALGIATADFLVGDGRNLVVVLCVSVLASADGFNSSLMAGTLNAHRKRGLSSLVELLDKAKYAVAVLAIYQWGGGYIVALGSFVAMAVSLLVLSNYLYQKTFSAYRLSYLEIPPLTDYRSSLIAYSSPFMIWGLFTWAQTFLERYMLEHYQSMTDVAAYSIINQFGFQTVSLGVALLIQVISPILFKETKSGITSTLKLYRIIGYCIALMTGVLLLTIFYAPDILVLLTDDKYGQYATWLPWMMIAGMLFAIGQLLSIQLMINLKPGLLLKPKISAALLEIALLRLLVPSYSIGGVVASSIAANAVYCGGVLLMIRAKTRSYELVG